MIPELGHFALILALVMALVQAVVPLMGAQENRQAMMAVARPAAFGQFLFIAIAYGCLTWAFIEKDFSVLYVAMHSNTDTPLMYRITGVWGSHEGSLLLWGMTLSAWTFAVAVFSRKLPDVFVARVLGVLGLISVGFLLFLLMTSNPFERLLPAAFEGRDLNPLLQDPGMIIHPPLLYMGYVGFSVAFAFAIAALLTGRLDAAWARWSRPWTTAAWVFLTAGIALGSGWAYYELGWGGWWFWDPVENSSFMPWLLGTALIHSLAVTEKRAAFRSWTVLLALGTFSLSLLGTFLVRSGVLTSVHAFATDPERGLFILVLLLIVIGSSLVLFAIRASSLSEGGSFELVSRDTSLLANNLLLTVVSFTVLIGTMYPLILDAFGADKISVGPPYFEAVFVPLMVPVVLLMVVGPFLRWKSDRLAPLLARLTPAFLISLAVGAGAAYWAGSFTWRTVLGLFLAAWVVLGCLQLLISRMRSRGRTSAAWWGMWLAHLGVGIFIIGVTVVSNLTSSLDVKMKVGERVEFAGYTLRLQGVEEAGQLNYAALRATLELSRNGEPIGQLTPEKRVYLAQGMPMTEASLNVGLFRDIYVALGDNLQDDSWIVHLHYKPFISWIWGGCVLMGLGGLFAMADRRYRAPSRRPALA